jgi:hypothetical protein
MRTAIKGRLITLAVAETVIVLVLLFVTTNPAVFAVVMIGLPFALYLVCAPLVLLFRSKQSSDPN